MAEGRQGPFGWTAMGCVTVVLVAVPLWFGLTSTFVYLWGDNWAEEMGLSVEVALFAIPLVWWVSAIQGVLLLLLLVALAGLFWLVVGAGRWILERRAHGDAVRYASLAGDTTLRADAWADTSKLPEPDDLSDDTTEEGG